MSKTRGIIAAGHAATAEAAAIILREGGNAFDAAVAAFLASFIAEPCMSSPGGGAFMTAHTAEGASTVYDFFVQTPQRKLPAEQTEFFPVELDFGTAKETFHVGMGSVGVPGAMAGAFAIAEHLGSMPMTELAVPAIQLAKSGVLVDDFQSHDFHLLEPILSIEKGHPVFWKGEHLIEAGETMFMPELADCLDYLARTGVREFYEGDVAHLILKHNDRKGGHLQAADMADYRVLEHAPLAVPFRDKTVLTNPLPSLGGSLIALALADIAAETAAAYDPGSPEHSQQILDTFVRLSQVPRTQAGLAAALAERFPDLSLPPVQGRSLKIGGTSHFSILDEFGNAVSISTSNGEGCGHFVPGTGIIMNNMLGESALLPDGLHSWIPGQRLGSMMSPTILLDADGDAETVLGTGGAGRIPFMLVQAIHRMVDLQQPLETAVQAPRLHFHEGICNLEPGFAPPAHLPRAVREVLQWERQSLYFGGVHAVARTGRDLTGCGDQRRGGVQLLID